MPLTARPRPEVVDALPPGETVLPLATGRPGLLHVPTSPVRGLVVTLHGAGGSPRAAVDLLAAQAEEHGLVLLAPASAASTWAGLFERDDPDTDALDAALTEVFSRQALDGDAVAVAGFSDGGSYALGLGLANGGLFGAVVAFSPGFAPPGPRTGRPAFFLTHGLRDTVLPIGRTSRRIVPALRRDGYPVTYHEFDGGHVVPPAYRAEAATWLAGQRSGTMRA